MTFVVRLTKRQVDVLREALEYGKLQVQASAGAPSKLKQEKVEVIDSILREVSRVAMDGD